MPIEPSDRISSHARRGAEPGTPGPIVRAFAPGGIGNIGPGLDILGCAVTGPGDTVEIPPNATQFVMNDGPTPLTFLCIVDPGWRAEDEEVL